MKAYKLALLLPLTVFLPVSAQAEPQDMNAYAPGYNKPRYKIARKRYLPPAAPVAVLPVVAPVPAYVPKPYSWSGFFVGGYAGVAADRRNPQISVPTYGNLQGNDIGFAGSNNPNAYNVDSQNYNYLAGSNNGNTALGPTTAGYTTYNATASAFGFNTNAGNTAVANNGTVTTSNGAFNNGINANVQVTPYNNLPGNRTDSQLSVRDNSRRLLGMFGGEVGYQKQFGLFVIGIAADGGYIDGKRTQTSNSTGQFSNNQGANSQAQAAECTGGNGNGGCGSSLTNNSTGGVNLANNGNSSFTQSITSGPQWLGTARLNAGVAIDRAMIYATGGFAYGQSDLAVSASYRDVGNQVCSGVPQTGTAGSVAGGTSTTYSCNGVNNTNSSATYSNAAQWSGNRSKFMTGFAIGTGAAFAVTDNVILKLEGLYYNLGNISTTATGTGTTTLTVNQGAAPPGSTPGTRAASVSSFFVNRQIDGFIAKVGVAVKFDTGTPDPLPTVVSARY